jgi:urea transporter
MSLYQMIKVIFRGVGQVMFQNNALSGVLMLVGIGCNSLSMCLFALLGTTISTLTAIALK